MAVLHTPIIIPLPSTRLITSPPPTTPKTLHFANVRTPGCFIKHFFRIRATPLQKYVYPDPIPEFAVHETKKFREELKKKLYAEREMFGDDLDRVLDTCAEVGGSNPENVVSDVKLNTNECSRVDTSTLFSDFLHNEYGGSGTLLVEPFTNMLIELKQRKLPGANLAARASLLWAQNYLDRDWEIWNSKST